jgi:membrane protease YdiL (CAAX protease family)
MAETEQRPNGFAMAVVVEGGLALAAVLLAWVLSVPIREQIPATGEQLAYAIARGVALTVPMFALFVWIVHSSWTPFRELRQLLEWLITELFPTASPAQLAFVAVLAGVGEEFLFRGVLQPVIGQWTTPLIGLVITSLIFGVVHSVSKLYFFLATVIGLCLGALALQYNDLVAPMVAHTLHDFLALVYLSRRLRLSGESGQSGQMP